MAVPLREKLEGAGLSETRKPQTVPTGRLYVDHLNIEVTGNRRKDISPTSI